ncbi:helix-turn-helix domain-containing protein [Aquimarina latercula]|uniref:helix-turn-helix domain-containing protein n=1 Tax=Aquimarina latercula TaxID=987 RepID=UPI0004230FC3|nr:helix-turn-helix transcriptional regulator [Aquimarina latercula]
MSITFVDINKKLDRFFTNKGLTSYRVSKLTGLSEPTINRYRQGKSQPTSSKLQKLLSVFPELESLLFGGLSEEEKNIINLTQKLEKTTSLKSPISDSKLLDQIPKSVIINYIKDNEDEFGEYTEYKEFISNRAKDIAINLLIDKINSKSK